VAKAVVGQEASLALSDTAVDWLGPGIYFWEADPARALEWAKTHRRNYENPTLIGAVIDLGNCLDLTNRSDLELVKAAHDSFIKEQERAGLPVPKNKSVRDKPDEDRLLRYLDCAVIKHLHDIMNKQPDGPERLPPYDSVRGMFTEGCDLYPGAGFKERSHTQIAVLNSNCLKGLFFPPAY
jgi:hypothetical protein